MLLVCRQIPATITLALIFISEDPQVATVSNLTNAANTLLM
jgi:hypothetical protein